MRRDLHKSPEFLPLEKKNVSHSLLITIWKVAFREEIEKSRRKYCSTKDLADFDKFHQQQGTARVMGYPLGMDFLPIQRI
jgi:hypothetical protein